MKKGLLLLQKTRKIVWVIRSRRVGDRRHHNVTFRAIRTLALTRRRQIVRSAADDTERLSHFWLWMKACDPSSSLLHLFDNTAQKVRNEWIWKNVLSIEPLSPSHGYQLSGYLARVCYTFIAHFTSCEISFALSRYFEGGLCAQDRFATKLLKKYPWK